jgi:hypothetical protein
LGNWVIGVFDEKPNYPIIPINLTQLINNWVFILFLRNWFQKCKWRQNAMENELARTLEQEILWQFWVFWFFCPLKSRCIGIIAYCIISCIMFNRYHLKIKSINLIWIINQVSNANLINQFVFNWCAWDLSKYSKEINRYVLTKFTSRTSLKASDKEIWTDSSIICNELPNKILPQKLKTEQSKPFYVLINSVLLENFTEKFIISTIFFIFLGFLN